MRGAYEIIGPDYFAPQASAGRDVRRWSLSSQHPLGAQVMYNWSYNVSEDNARNQNLHMNWSRSQSHSVTANPFRSQAGPEEEGTAGHGVFARLEPENLRVTLRFGRSERGRTDMTVNSKAENYAVMPAFPRPAAPSRATSPGPKIGRARIFSAIHRIPARPASRSVIGRPGSRTSISVSPAP